MPQKITVQNKEQTLLYNICECCKVIDNFKLSKNVGKYNFNFTQLYESVADVSEACEQTISCGFNKLAYFQKVYKFIETYNLPVQHNLFESENGWYLSMFKSDLKSIIQKLKEQNDFNRASNKFIGIKAFAGIPINLHGIEVGKNLIANAEVISNICALFGITTGDPELISIIYNRSTSELYFASLIYGLVSYNSESDEFRLLYSGRMELDNYLEQVKSITQYNDLVEIYTNKEILYNSERFKFQDNLYADVKQSVYQQQLVAQRAISKK